MAVAELAERLLESIRELEESRDLLLKAATARADGKAAYLIGSAETPATGLIGTEFENHWRGGWRDARDSEWFTSLTSILLSQGLLPSDYEEAAGHVPNPAVQGVLREIVYILQAELDFDEDSVLDRQPWISLRSGERLFLLDPDPDLLVIEDIAWALARVPRYAAQSTRVVSVAEHSVLVSKLCSQGWEMEGLLHDAPEAFIGDLTRPLKRLLPMVAVVDRLLRVAVAKRFGVFRPGRSQQLISGEVSVADGRALAMEWAAVMRDEAFLEAFPHKPPRDTSLAIDEILCASPEEAERRFLARYKELDDVR